MKIKYNESQLSDLLSEGGDESQKRIGTKDIGESLAQIADAEIERMLTDLDITNGTEQVAKAIYRRSLEGKVIENTTIFELCAGCVYAAVRVESKPYTAKAIPEVARSTEKRVANVFAELSKQLGLKVGPVQPEHYVPRYCEDLSLSESTEMRAIQLIETGVKHEIHTGRSPSGFAANAVYAASLLTDEMVTQERLSEVTGTSIRTVRDTYKMQLIAEGEEIEVNEDDESE